MPEEALKTADSAASAQQESESWQVSGQQSDEQTQSDQQPTQPLKLSADSSGVYLTLQAAEITLPAVARFLFANGVRKYNEKAVEEIVRNRIHTPQRIAERNAANEKDAVISTQLAKDNLSVTLAIDPPFFEKPWPTKKDIKAALDFKNVVFGIDEDAIDEVLKLKLAGDSVVVARGLPPVNGEHAKIELLVDPDKPPEVDEEADVVDHRSRSSFVLVSKGDKVAVKTPATPGTSGKSIIGVEIPPVPGKDVPFPIGSGLELSEDGLTLIASIDGRLSKKDNKLVVLPELDVHGDVDFGVGNIDFQGTVKIRGSVREGFVVIASGDVEIYEVVEGARVESKGNIIVRGGVRGTGKALITANGSIKMGFVDQASIRSRGSISVKNAILHSDVMAEENVVVSGGQRSQIAGGKIQAGRAVMCQTLGSEMGTKTEVVVGLPPEQAERRKELQNLIAENRAELVKADSNIEYLKKLDEAGKLDDDKRILMAKLTQAKFKIQAAMGPMKAELNDIDDRLDLAKASGVVKVKGVCYPGVSINIRGVNYVVREPFKYAAFVFEDGDVKVRSYDF
ncbi:MAG: FapA family protein [Synergistaceae bacterium]|jgi:uncharacterized protein (DUF342 family)|nr:FapA family protein [Synergistaceae bacterium]